MGIEQLHPDSAKRQMNWLESVSLYCIRKKEHGSNKLKRTGNSTTSIMCFMTTIKKTSDKEADLQKLMKISKIRAKTFVKAFCLFFEQCRRSGHSVQCSQTTSGVNDKGNPAGLFGWLLHYKHGNDHEEFQKRISKNLKTQFKNDIQFKQQQINLDKYLADYDIKEIARNYFNASQWNDVPQNARQVFYKHKWNLNRMPQWDTIVNEPYKL